MTSPQIVTPDVFVIALNQLINAHLQHQPGWEVRLEQGVIPHTYKLVPIGGIPERLVRDCCSELMRYKYPSKPIGVAEL